MDCEKRYFLKTFNFNPDYSKELTLVENDIYRHIETGELYRKRLLCDHGWGPECGYVLYPEPTFDQLIKLVEYQPKHIKGNPLFFFSKKIRDRYFMCRDNAQGAAALIVQDHLDELIHFLYEKINTDYFEDKEIRERFRLFMFDRIRAKEFGSALGATINRKGYEEIYREHKDWQAISQKVIDQVYRKDQNRGKLYALLTHPVFGILKDED